MTVGDYYGLEGSNMIRLEEFSDEGVIRTIKKMAAKNCIAELKPNNVKSQLKHGVTNELIADRLFRKMIKLFMDRGKELNLEGKYVVNNSEITLDNNNNKECTYLTVAKTDTESVEDLVEMAEQARKKEAHRLKKGK